MFWMVLERRRDENERADQIDLDSCNNPVEAQESSVVDLTHSQKLTSAGVMLAESLATHQKCSAVTREPKIVVARATMEM
nr:hypothetical protein CFP56_54860 [Quercus suber]